MDYNNTLKARISEAVSRILLEDAGYLVSSLGIENIVNTLPTFSKEAYLRLGVPPTLRKLPDFFVVDQAEQKIWLLEVKYRKKWDEGTKRSLAQKLLEQVRCYQNITLLLVVGESAHNPSPGYSPSEEPAYRVRVVPLSLEQNDLVFLTCSNSIKKFAEAFWEDFWRIQDYFGKLGSRWNEQTIRKGIELLKGLNKINLL